MPYSKEADFTVDQPSGAVWSVYEDPNHDNGFTIVTSSGAELLASQGPAIRDLITRYRAAEIGSMALLGPDDEMRAELGRGSEARVYAMGPYAVRETVGITGVYAAIGELQRMDAINEVMEQGLPRWLQLPVHYGMHVDPNPKIQKTYILMDKIDAGVTVEDILKYPDVTPEKHRAVLQSFGNGIKVAKREVPGLYDAAYEALATALEKSGREPSLYLTDWKRRNVIVEPVRTPVAKSKHRLTVIDQYTV